MKKLRLNKETVRDLDDKQMTVINGASGPGATCNPGICYELPSQQPCPLTAAVCETDLCTRQTRIC